MRNLTLEITMTIKMTLGVLMLALAASLTGCKQEIHPRDHNGLQLSYLCDGSLASAYGEELLEREDCGSGKPVLPTARLEDSPRFASPYVLCDIAPEQQTAAQRFDCFERSFWDAYSDGRRKPRQDALSYMSTLIALAEADNDGSASYVQQLSRMYQLRGMFYMAMGIENGALHFIILNGFYSGKDFARVSVLEPGNFVAASFDVTMDMANLRVRNQHDRAEVLAKQALMTAWHAGAPDVIEPINVGSMFAVSGVTMHYPLRSGVPALTLDATLAVGCIPEVEFCNNNTLHAPFARPGLEYHLAEIYARMGMREDYIRQLDVVAQQPGYADWAWKDLVELQRANPERLLEKFASYGDEQYSEGYATRNMGCVFCHGRI
jgi:hypothetical protein